MLQVLPPGCHLEVVTVQEQVEDRHVEKVVCETEFRHTCTVTPEQDCRTVTRPVCSQEERMECEPGSVRQCAEELRLGDTGEQEQVEVRGQAWSMKCRQDMVLLHCISTTDSLPQRPCFRCVAIFPSRTASW